MKHYETVSDLKELCRDVTSLINKLYDVKKGTSKSEDLVPLAQKVRNSITIASQEATETQRDNILYHIEGVGELGFDNELKRKIMLMQCEIFQERLDSY
jgi:hypothetical protein